MINKNIIDNIKISFIILLSIHWYIETNRYKIHDYYYHISWKIKQLKKKYFF